MTREEIKKLDYDSPYHFETDREEDWYKIGCIDGLDAADAEPDTTELWHDANDIPNNDSIIIYESVYGDILLKRFTNRLSAMANVFRWAYVNDLLPKGGEK